MEKIRISAVKYANTYPFIYGLTESGFGEKAIIETDHPAECAAKLIDNRADVGLIPVGALPLLKEYHIISDYCIGANGNVRTVMLLSNTPFDSINTVYLDYRSRSSVNLVKVLARNSWKKDFRWIGTEQGFDFTSVREGEASVLIGDQCFRYEKNFRYTVDLAGAWKEYTGLPFVFACWVANKKLKDDFIRDFNMALEPGLKNIDAVVEKYGKSGTIKGAELKKYLTENIDYDFNDDKKKALRMFLSQMAEVNA
jgi:chorismate dehydratase